MQRALLAAVVLLAFAAAPAQAAVQAFGQDLVLYPDTRPSMVIDGGSGDSFELEWTSDTPIDVFVVHAANSTVIDDPATVPLVQALNQSSGRVHATLPGDGPWSLVLDNRAGPAGGANGTMNATLHVAVAPYLLEVPPPATGGGSLGDQAAQADGRHEEAPTLWNTFLFDSWTWAPGDAVGFNGVALWAILVLVAACVRFDGPLKLTVQLALAAAAFVTLWSLLPYVGPLTEIGLCAVAGAGLAWVACRRVAPLWSCLRVILVATIVGTFAGDVLAYGLKHLWSDPGLLVFGNRRFEDEVFTVPGFALTMFILARVIPELVHALEPDEEGVGSSARGPMPPDVFNVRCLRCGTDIKVDRSMKRFRVATDRFEFACPNCQYWMEWADPNQKGAAAA